MIDVCLLGTSGQRPTLTRQLASAFVAAESTGILFDCGEGTQLSLQKNEIRAKRIDYICITHYHADHIAGLLGVLLAIQSSGKNTTVTIVGPSGLRKVFTALTSLTGKFKFPIVLDEFTGKSHTCKIPGGYLKAFPVLHSVECYGYTVELIHKPKFIAKRAEALGIPKYLWSTITDGMPILYNGHSFDSDMFYGSPRIGLKICYCVDSRPTKSIVENANDSDLFICEGMYADDSQIDKAVDNMHMTMYEAAALAKEAGVKELWTTHYSNANVNPVVEQENLRKIFPNTTVAMDGQSKSMIFRRDIVDDEDTLAAETEKIKTTVETEPVTALDFDDILANL